MENDDDDDDDIDYNDWKIGSTSDIGGINSSTNGQTNNRNITPSDEFRVAIVGAGFAGLVLANYLTHKISSKAQPLYTDDDNSVTPQSQRRIGSHEQDHHHQQQLQQHSHQWSYQLFEAKARPIPVIGTISLPFARQLLFQELGGLRHDVDDDEHSREKDEDEEEDVFVDPADGRIVSREAFLEYLRRRVTIRYSHKVVNVIKRRTATTTSCGGYHPNNRRRRRRRTHHYFVETDTQQRYGPFDLVVAADGLFGRRTIEMVHEDRSEDDADDCDGTGFARIGDGRWLDRIWWDFGTTRIKCGANIAIQDGLQLGKLLVDQGGYDFDLGKFTEPSPSAQSRRWIRRLSLLLLLLCPTLVAIIYQQIQHVEQL